MWILIGFYLFIKFFNKKCFPLWHLICSFEKQLGGRKIWSMKNLKKKKNRKMLKKRYYLQQKLESNFWPGKRWNLIFSISGKVLENWSSLKKKKKKKNPKSIGSLSRKLWPKYETSDEDNTNSASSSIFFQNFKWESTSNLFKFI